MSRLQELLLRPEGDAGDEARLRVETELRRLDLEARNWELHQLLGRMELSQARYAALYHGAPVAFCTLSRQGLVLELNDAARALLGRAPTRLAAFPLAPLLAEESRPLLWDHLRRCVDRQHGVCTEVSLAPGATREVRVQLLGVPSPETVVTYGFHTAIIDVTAERLAQRRLQALTQLARKLGEARDERAALEALCASARDHITDVCAAWLDEPEGGPLCAVAAPPAAEERLREALASRSLPPELLAMAREAAPGSPVMGLSRELSSWLFGGTGEPATAAVAVAMLPAGDGARGWLLAVARPPRPAFAAEDLAVLQQLADRLGESIQWRRLYRKALREVQVREDFLAIVSHDLVNAAASIKLTAESMGNQAVAAAQQGNMRRIHSSAEWIMSVVRKLLDVAALESGHIPVDAEPIPAGALLEEARDALAPAAEEHRIQLQLSTERDLWVRADGERLLQVFSNLVVNALKHAPPESTVELGVQRAGAEAHFYVRDQGPGIAREDLPHVFDRFWQARRAKRAGVGLGLSIVKAIVEAHGGRAGAQSGERGGATVWFVLPAIESPAAGVPQPVAERHQEERT
jgi:PAS domain S-box-containing protein